MVRTKATVVRHGAARVVVPLLTIFLVPAMMTMPGRSAQAAAPTAEATALQVAALGAGGGG
jgi:hypothetical protein